MTTQTQLGVVPMDDKMDMALSPFQPAEDFDLDFDHMDEPNQPQADDTMVEHEEHGYGIDNTMVDEDLDVLEDDDMLEDGQKDHNDQGHQLDEEVSGHPNKQTEEQIIEDEDILYDDENEDQQMQKHETAATEFGTIGLSLEQAHHQILDHQRNPVDEVASDENSAIDTSNAYTQGKDEQSRPSLSESTTADTTNTDIPNADSKAPEEQDPIHEEQVEAQNDTSLPAAIQKQGDTDDGSATGDLTADQEPVASDQNQQLLDLAAIEDSAVDAALHSIRLFWNNEEWRLFSSQHDASDCFFHSTELAYEPMDKLLEACRGVIPANELDDHDELTLVVDELGLNICEDSKYAPSLTLAHIIELYLTLHRNGSQDTVTVIPCSLQSRTCLQTCYGRLLQDAMSGRNLTEIVGDVIESPDDPVGDGSETTLKAQDELQHGQQNAEFVENVEDTVPEAEPASDAPVQAADILTDSRQAEPVHEPSAISLEETAKADGDSHEHVDDGENDLLDVFDDEGEEEPKAPPQEQVDTQDFGGNESFALDADPVDETGQHDPGSFAEEKSTTGSIPAEEAHDIIGQSFTGDDDPDYEDPGAPAPVGDDFYNSEDEMLRLRQEEFRRASVEMPNLEPQISFDIDGGAHDLITEGQDAGDPEPEEELDLVSMPPETPQKGSDKKRKAFDEDDEFDLSGLDTPEPKRRRPS